MTVPGHGEYLPLGKLRMILGGVGSVRLSAKQTAIGRRHFLGATKSGVSHEGIPISLPEDIYLEIAPRLHDLGACACNIVGTIQVAPNEASAVSYDPRIPKYMVAVSDIEIQDSARPRARVSVSIVYRGAAREHETGSKADRDLGWSFITFDPCIAKPGSKKGLDSAVDWLKAYARRHSVINDPPIFCDFDEITEHFDMPVDFKIQDLFRGDLDARIVERYSKIYGVKFHIHNYGDVFSNISDSTIINRSMLS